MHPILTSLSSHPRVEFSPGEFVLHQGEQTGHIYFLIEGLVAILRSGTQISEVSEPGAVFGEMSILLNTPHTATVQAVVRSSFLRVEDGAALLRDNAAASAYIATILARRVNGLSRYLVDLKQQFKDRDDHLGMVDEVLDALVNRHPRAIQRRAVVDP